MPTNTPKKSLPKGNGGDNARDYLKGAIAGGGLWTALDILDNTILDTIADAKGDIIVGTAADTIGRLAVGPNGTFLVADSAQPTGLGWSSSLTLTGPVDMQADATVHDTLYFGAKPNGAADTNLKRNAAGGLTLTAPVNQAALITTAAGAYTGLQVASHQGNVFNNQADIRLTRQAPTGDDQWIWFQGGASAGDMLIGRRANQDDLRISLWNGASLQNRLSIGPYNGMVLTDLTAPSTSSFNIVSQTNANIGFNDSARSGRVGFVSGGTLLLYNDSAGAGLQIGTAGNIAYISTTGQTHQFYIGGTLRWNFDINGTINVTPNGAYPAISVAAGANAIIASQGTNNVQFNSSGNFVHPDRDNIVHLGAVSLRWLDVWAVTGTIQTSSAEAKRDINPLNPDDCAQAVLDTDWVSFTYLPSEFIEPEPPPEIAYDEHDDNETKAEKKAKRDALVDDARKLHAQQLLETRHTRQQNGYVLGSDQHKTHDLFGLGDRQTKNNGSDLGIVAAALQNALHRIAALEAAQ